MKEAIAFFIFVIVLAVIFSSSYHFSTKQENELIIKSMELGYCSTVNDRNKVIWNKCIKQEK